MKKKTAIIVIVGALVLLFVCLSVFFALRGISASNKQQEYFDVYRLQAENYIKASPDITNKYGDNISVEFDKSVTYSESKQKNFFDIFTEVFHPQVPETLDEFNKGIDMIKFNVEINGDSYEIIFEKNDQGQLSVSSLTTADDL